MIIKKYNFIFLILSLVILLSNVSFSDDSLYDPANKEFEIGGLLNFEIGFSGISAENPNNPDSIVEGKKEVDSVLIGLPIGIYFNWRFHKNYRIGTDLQFYIMNSRYEKVDDKYGDLLKDQSYWFLINYVFNYVYEINKYRNLLLGSGIGLLHRIKDSSDIDNGKSESDVILIILVGYEIISRNAESTITPEFRFNINLTPSYGADFESYEESNLNYGDNSSDTKFSYYHYYFSFGVKFGNLF